MQHFSWLSARVVYPFLLHERSNHIAFDFFRFVKVCFQHGFKLLLHFTHHLLCSNSFAHQLLRVNFARVGMFRNGFIQNWLSKTRFITFVVAVLAVTQQVYENIALKALTVFNSQTHRVDQSFGIIAVNVKNRC